MGLLPLITSTLLFSWTTLNAAVKITKVDLSIEPSADVERNTDVALRCKAEVLTSGTEALNRVYTVYKGESVIYNKTTSSSEDLLYRLPQARVSNNGKYKCAITIMGKAKTSEAATLTVTGMSTPVLRINKANITEGESVTATCLAQGETGSLLFSFHDNSKEVENGVWVTSSRLTFVPKGVGNHNIHCSYLVLNMPYPSKSQQSNTVTLTVEELSIEPVLKISPQDNVYEGDTLNITCSVSNSTKGYQAGELFLSQDTELLESGETYIHVNWTAHARTPVLTIRCQMDLGDVEKVVSKTVSVRELFSVPTLKVSAVEVFQEDEISLTCRSEKLSYDRLEGESLIYSLEPFDYQMVRKGNGVFVGKAKTIDFNYTCTAAAKGIKKKSNVLTIHPKVPVSTPKIWVSGSAVLGKRVAIFCLSDTGTPPITYTLWKASKQNQIAVVHEFNKAANFSVVINETGRLNHYLCTASNGDRTPGLSDKLQTAVIEPMTTASLMVVPDVGDISEGHSVILICSFLGTPPVTVKWFRDSDDLNPLDTTTTNSNNTNYEFIANKEHTDSYYCRAENRANSVKSNKINVVVGMAMWKKLLIPGTIILVVFSLVMVGFILFTRSRRVRVDRTPESVWSSRKPEAETDDDLSTLSNEPEVEYTEVVHPRSSDPAKNPLRKGTDTVYSELQNSPHGATDHHDYGSVKYVDLNGDQQPRITQHSPKDSSYSDLPMPVD
ncbi:platelet endothelial cell adhesion molecule isoform X1 [Poecilia latipinna]|uniref:platelet endothelial cell adhesion molecule isoform X1 n=1 Tax=Poecilia latipinna TaxID=48699 RepID=UPI00072EBECF|nr:PREDICTED: platelet endothelial cell adhesion molecule-like isoform X1 [Poecilia latipinna]